VNTPPRADYQPDTPAVPAPATGTCPPERCKDCRLRRTEAFLPIDADDLLFIEAFRTGISRVPAGSPIIPEFRASSRLFTLYSGWAFRYKTLSDGRRQILNFLLPGDFIGLQEEFVDQSTHGVEALTDTMLCEFPRDGLWELFREKPELGYQVTWLASREEALVDDQLLTVGRRSAAERVAMLLITLFRRAERLGLVQDGATEFPLTQQHVADALGLSLVHTNKTLRQLHKMGLHRVEDGRLHLLNARALSRLADWAERPMRRVPLV
jgi:CRP-like cAMP-binding protein